VRGQLPLRSPQCRAQLTHQPRSDQVGLLLGISESSLRRWMSEEVEVVPLLPEPQAAYDLALSRLTTSSYVPGAATRAARVVGNSSMLADAAVETASMADNCIIHAPFHDRDGTHGAWTRWTSTGSPRCSRRSPRSWRRTPCGWRTFWPGTTRRRTPPTGRWLIDPGTSCPGAGSAVSWERPSGSSPDCGRPTTRFDVDWACLAPQRVFLGIPKTSWVRWCEACRCTHVYAGRELDPDYDGGLTRGRCCVGRDLDPGVSVCVGRRPLRCTESQAGVQS